MCMVSESDATASDNSGRAEGREGKKKKKRGGAKWAGAVDAVQLARRAGKQGCPR